MQKCNAVSRRTYHVLRRATIKSVLRKVLIVLSVIGVLAVLCALAVADTAVPIRTGVVFTVPLADGSTTAARCEIIEGKTRLTYIQGGRFVDLLLSPWEGPAPQPDPVPQPDPQPDVNPYKPNDEYKADCVPLSRFDLTEKDAVKLSKFYADLGVDISAADSKIVTTYDLWITLLMKGPELGLKGKYAGLGDAVEKCFTKTLTLENYKLDKVKAAALLQTVAWAVYESGRSK
jgi:hypothetical protein